MTDEIAARPIAEFPIKFRGYSRRDVDRYVDATRELFEQAEARARAAEAEATRWRDEAIQLGQRTAELEQQLDREPPRTFTAVRERLDRMLVAAEEVTAAMIASAQAEATDVVTTTRERAEANASQLAAHVIGQAREIQQRAEVLQTRLLDELVTERTHREQLLSALAPLSVGLSQLLPNVAQVQESLLHSVERLNPAEAPPALPSSTAPTPPAAPTEPTPAAPTEPTPPAPPADADREPEPATGA